MSLPTAPVITVSGKTLSWSPQAGVTSWVFVRKIAGQPDHYTVIDRNIVTPPDQPGETVHYSVRANVSGAPWAKEVSITYPAVTVVPLPPVPAQPPAPVQPAPGRFPVGIVVGSALLWELSYAKLTQARTARMEFAIGASVATLAPVIDAYARAGIRPHLLAGFYGRIPTDAEARNLATWAAAFGPGGTFWQGKTYPPNVAVTDIEFGNETSYSYQWSDNTAATYTSRARAYGTRFALAQAVIHDANPRVGLLAIADGMNPAAWVAGMVAAAHDAIAAAHGFALHPYGSSWKARIDGSIAALAAVGIVDLTNRLFITEWGLSSDNGRTLSDNYGWDKSMTYDEAAATFKSVLAAIRSGYGGRVAEFFVYAAHDLYATGTRTGREAYFGDRQSNGEPKGAYTQAVEAETAGVTA